MAFAPPMMGGMPPPMGGMPPPMMGGMGGMPPPMGGMPPPMGMPGMPPPGAPPMAMGGMPPPGAPGAPPAAPTPVAPPVVLPKLSEQLAAEAECEPPPPGDGDAFDGRKSPPLEFFSDPLPCEVAYGAEEAKRSQREAVTMAQGGPGTVNPAMAAAPAHGWRRVENAGVAYWYNDRTGVSQWDEPPEVKGPAEGGKPERKLLYDPAVGPRNDDFEALCQAAEGDSICEPIGDGVLLRVIVKPAQEEDGVLEVKDFAAFVSLRAPIEDRWCNQALLAFCRRALHVPQRERNAVKITDGDESLDKIVHIPALSPKEVVKRLHKKKDFEVDTNDVEKWIRHTERKQKEEERRMKRRKWA